MEKYVFEYIRKIYRSCGIQIVQLSNIIGVIYNAQLITNAILTVN